MTISEIIGYVAFLLLGYMQLFEEPFKDFFYRQVPGNSGKKTISEPKWTYKATVVVLFLVSLGYHLSFRNKTTKALEDCQNKVEIMSGNFNVPVNGNVENQFIDNSNNHGGGIHHNSFNYHKDSFKGGEIDVRLQEGDKIFDLKADENGELKPIIK